MSVPLGFRFNAAQFSACVLAETPAPPYTHVRIAVDPAYFSNATSDQSAISTGFQGDDFSFTLLDSASGRWKGIELPNRIVTAIETWDPYEVWIERTGNGAPDMLVDVIKMECELKGIRIPQITFFTPSESKADRVFKLQALVESQQLHICPGTFTSTLIQQARDFTFTQTNSRREDGCLDSLAAVCGFKN